MKEQPKPPETLIRDAGLRCTPVRLALLKALAAAKGPTGAPALAAQVAGLADAVTVYRTLNSFTQKRLVHRVAGDNGWQYAIGRAGAAREHQHPHFVCDGCGAVACVDSASIPTGLARSFRIAGGYRVSHAEVVLHGRCPTCG